jgi:pSer/pThr/pTyr-binding forkhead associated (FHA) protein
MAEDGESAAGGRKAAGPVPSGASVKVMRGFYQGLELPVNRDWVVIGRGRSADLAIAEPTISRAHAAIGYGEEGFFVQDLGSTNGTRVNGKRESQASLHDGDELQLGKLQLRVTLPSQSLENGVSS